MNGTGEDDSPFEITTTLKIMIPATAIPILLIGGFGNISVIVAVMKSQTLRTVPNIFTITLMALSFLVSCYGYPIQLFFNLYLIKSQPICYLLGSSMVSISVQHSMVLLFVTLERYVKICLPFKAHAIFTPRNVTVTISIILVYGLMAGMGAGGLLWIGKDELWRSQRRCNLLFMLPSDLYIKLLMIHWLLPIPVMIIIYARIFFVVRRHIRAIAALTPAYIVSAGAPVASVAEPVATGASRDRASGSPPQVNTHRRLVREAKTAFIMFLVVITYFLCWVPFSIFALILIEKGASPETFVAMHCIAYSSGFITPYVYGLGTKEFRHTLFAMLLPKCCSKTSENERSIPSIRTGERELPDHQ